MVAEQEEGQRGLPRPANSLRRKWCRRSKHRVRDCARRGGRAGSRRRRNGRSQGGSLRQVQFGGVPGVHPHRGPGWSDGVSTDGNRGGRSPGACLPSPFRCSGERRRDRPAARCAERVSRLLHEGHQGPDLRPHRLGRSVHQPSALGADDAQ